MNKVKVKSIAITRAEGPAVLCGRTAIEPTFTKANSLLLSWSTTAPKGGGYDKCDFVITWEDGYTYDGRYDLKHSSHGLPDLRSHVSGNVAFMAGTSRPFWMNDKQWSDTCQRYETSGIAAEARQLLEEYALDDPIPESSWQFRAKVYDFGRDTNGNAIAHFTLFEGYGKEDPPVVYQSKRRQQTGTGDYCDAASVKLAELYPKYRFEPVLLRGSRTDGELFFGFRVFDK